MLRSRLPELEVATAGTQARHGHPVHPFTAAAVSAAGFDASEHASRLLQEPLLAGVDLVLTAERAHRSTVLGLRPALLRRTFTLQELVALAQAVAPRLPAGETAAAIEAVVAERGRHPAEAADLPDPVNEGPEAHAKMVRAVQDSVERLVVALVRDTVTGTGSAGAG